MCIDTENTTLINYLDTITGMDYDDQYVCLDLEYTPTTSTEGSVTGSIIFTGWDVADRTTLLAANTWFLGHVRTANGEYNFNFTDNASSWGTVVGNDETVYLDSISLLHPIYRDATFTINLSWEVTWITPAPTRRSGWGGGWSSRDSCPSGDFSDSYYDGTCGVDDTVDMEEIDEGDVVERYVPESNNYAVTTIATYIDDLIDVKYTINTNQKNSIIIYRNEFVLALEQFLNKTISPRQARLRFIDILSKLMPLIK